MRRKCLRINRPFTLFNMGVADLAALTAFGLLSWQAASRFVLSGALRIGAAGLLFFLAYSLYFRLKAKLPPRYLINALRWHGKPDLLLVQADPAPVPLAVRLEAFRRGEVLDD